MGPEHGMDLAAPPAEQGIVDVHRDRAHRDAVRAGGYLLRARQQLQDQPQYTQPQLVDLPLGVGEEPARGVERDRLGHPRPGQHSHHRAPRARRDHPVGHDREHRERTPPAPSGSPPTCAAAGPTWATRSSVSAGSSATSPCPTRPEPAGCAGANHHPRHRSYAYATKATSTPGRSQSTSTAAKPTPRTNCPPASDPSPEPRKKASTAPSPSTPAPDVAPDTTRHHTE